MQTNKQIEKQYKSIREDVRIDRSKQKQKVSRKERDAKRNFS